MSFKREVISSFKMASGGSEYTSDEIFNFKCSPCLASNRNREAVKYCVECQGYCCQSCADIIHIMPALKGHTLLDNSNYKSSSLNVGLPAVPTERCSTHETKIVDMYCGNHDEVGCTTCMALNHRSCADVQSIPDIVDSKFHTTDVEKIHQKLQDLKIMMEKVMKTRQRLMNDLKKSKTEAVMAIKDFRKDMETILEQLEKESIKELEMKFVEEDLKLLEEKKKAEIELDGLKQAVNDLKKSEGNKAQHFVSLKMSLKSIAKTEDASRLLQTSVKVNIAFSFDPAILGFLQQLKTFGSVRHDSATALRSPRTSVYSAKSIGDLNIRVQNDNKICCVYGSCLTEDGSLLLADYSNNKIKRADIEKLSITDYCCVPGAPLGVCCTSKFETAVCLSSNIIQFVSLGNQMTTTRQIRMNHYCFGIGYKDDKLYITDTGKSIYVYDMTGNKLMMFTQNKSGQSLFSNNRNVAVSDVDDKLFVASGDKGLVITDEQGNHCQTFTDSELNIASGVCTDRRGNLFVSGCNSNNVIQIGREGKKMGVVAKSSDGLVGPESVCFDTRQCKLFITQQNDTVKVISLH
ncbi:uncharacterized protein LOC128553630 [Mercenaria mercenaria]|uniref:uncharacterized protein LOC128553630 n=1 Tax=Mercenaria mercenaria TaxID=6596 RepID=UPI00234ED83D|nr:uncharacterized protein LOC128553630 [Mercenaria mercenaria]XP_053390779.1 uncharacterized protein LOC128553630 [Mercenaria mercenaria]